MALGSPESDSGILTIAVLPAQLAHGCGYPDEQLPIPFGHCSKVVAELSQPLSITTGTPPQILASRFVNFGTVGNTLSVTKENSVERSSKAACKFLQRFKLRDNVTVFDARNVCARQCTTILKLGLSQIFLFAQISQPFADGFGESHSASILIVGNLHEQTLLRRVLNGGCTKRHNTQL